MNKLNEIENKIDKVDEKVDKIRELQEVMNGKLDRISDQIADLAKDIKEGFKEVKNQIEASEKRITGAIAESREALKNKIGQGINKTIELMQINALSDTLNRFYDVIILRHIISALNPLSFFMEQIIWYT